METSRIFVRNLPPTITEADFSRHFGARGQITDIKVLPQRRIGYVGYNTPEEARQAVKYFHRSFVRMSKISVELAKPVADPSLSRTRQPSSNAQASVTPRSEMPNREKGAEVKPAKRKREDLDESDPKLQEFLGVMAPGKKFLHTTLAVENKDTNQPPTVSEGESDSEYYDAISRRQTKRSRQITVTTAIASTNTELPKTRKEQTSNNLGAKPSEAGAIPMEVNDTSPVITTTAATDDDTWMTSHKNRLLDLVDDDEVTSGSIEPVLAIQEKPKALETVPPADITADVPPTNDEPEQEEEDTVLDSIRNTSRLFVRNLPYTATEDEIRQHFEKYGALEEVHVSTKRGDSNNNIGFAHVLYVKPDSAVDAFQSLDGTTFRGRMIHIIPASAKRDQQLDDFALAKLPLKTRNLLRKKAQAATSFNWNALYMNQDAVNTAMADRLGISKSELLDPTSADAAVKQALAETSTIQDTKAYFISNGVDLNSFKSGQRGDTSILVKNFQYGTTIEEIREVFQEHGQVLRVLMPPTGTLAIVQFAHAPEGKSAFSKLAYRRFKQSVLFLEKGPKNLFVAEPQQDAMPTESSGVQKLSAAELLEGGSNEEPVISSSLFVKNLNFSTTTTQLADAFRHLEGFRSARVKTKTDPKKPGQILSMGFGHVEFSSKSAAEAAMKSMDGHALHAHKLQVKASHRGHDAAEERKLEDAAKKVAGQRTKIVVKNLPFEATKKDIRSLMGTYGQLRTVRVPKNINSRSKGFAFAEFTTAREAENAMNALKDTHLLGRRLVLQFAEAETVDAEEEIAKMARKVGGQVNKVALQQLTGRGRRKVNLGDEEDEGEG